MEPNNRPTPLFSRTVRVGGKMYYCDIHEGRTGTPYLSLCENRRDKDGTVTRIRMFMGPDTLPQIQDALAEAAEWFRNHPVVGKTAAPAV
jgi:hypothetical protein